jgi:Rrf2 family protein
MEVVMNISKEVEYGLLAVAYVAKNSKDGLVKAPSISKEYGIPEIYLFRIMRKLVEVNILKSKRGPGGGYVMAKPTNDISILEIIEAVDGPLENTKEITRYTIHAQFAQNMETVCKNVVLAEKNILHKAKLSQIIK